MTMTSQAATGGGRLTAKSLRGSTRRRRKELIIHRLFFGAAFLSMIVSVLILLSLLGRAVTFLTNIDLSSLVSPGWFPRQGMYDIRTIFVGTLLVTGVGMLVAAPLGLGAAIYLSEYARPRVRRSLKPILETLASIPSVVIGFFALTFISPQIVRRLDSEAGIFSLAAAGIGVGILVIPLIASVAEDAMHAVPAALREAAYGLGAKRMSVSLRVVVPAAVSGIVAALILGVSRAVGETMVVAIAAGGTGGSLLTWNVLRPGQTMTAAMTSLAIGSDQVRGAGQAFNSLFFVGLILFVLTFGLNLMSERFVRRVRQRY
jgi:phosphate transport system permease protein